MSYDNTQYIPMEKNQRSLFDNFAIAGFLTIVFSTFMNFLPIFEKSWRAGAVGFPVMVASLFAILLVLRRQYFSAFFIGMFAAFFLVHEIIIIYDNKAVELGRELGSDGYFRLVLHIFRDALNRSYGAFWGFWGSVLAISGVIFAWMNTVIQANKIAAIEADTIAEELDTIEDEVEEEFSGPETANEIIADLDEAFFKEED